MALPFPFDWQNPDYNAIYAWRLDRLGKIKERAAHERAEKLNSSVILDMKVHYREHPAQFITDWGVTFDPRNVERGLPGAVPFILFPKQEEWVDWVIRKWRAGEPGGVEKSRDMGMSWLATSTSCTLCLLHEGMSIGFGSRKEEYVDKIGDPKSLFYKARFFMENLPVEFRGGWTPAHAPHMRLQFPETGSDIGGEAGDNIGRGDRRGIYIVDEAAYLEHPDLVEASLSQSTNCRIDISSVNGMANPFAQKRHAGKIEYFIFDWRDDPRKGEAWYAKQKENLDPVTLAQEVDRDYSASVEGVVIPGAWIRAAIDAADNLGIPITGAATMGYDVADEGKDKCAVAGGVGIQIDFLDEWTGIGSDMFKSTQRVFDICDAQGYSTLRYDADGIGADVRSHGIIINEYRAKGGLRGIPTEVFRGSGAVINPEGQDMKGRKNKDFFQNYKAQSWWSLRTLFQNTYRWRVLGVPCDPDEIISISSKCPFYLKLVTELSQPTYKPNGVGKIVIDKTPDGTKSPNLADAVMIKFARVGRPPMRISDDTLKQIANVGQLGRVVTSRGLQHG